MLSEARGQQGKRTLKALRAMLRGSWLLSWDWVTDSIAADAWLPEADYEIQVRTHLQCVCPHGDDCKLQVRSPLHAGRGTCCVFCLGRNS